MTALLEDFGGAFVDIAAGLLVPLAVNFLLSLFAALGFCAELDFLKSSATGGNA